MSSFKPYDDAEKGHLDELYTVQLGNSTHTLLDQTVYNDADNKKLLARADSNATLCTPSKNLSVSELSLIKGPTKKPVSTWVKFQLWFNAYKCVFLRSNIVGDY